MKSGLARIPNILIQRNGLTRGFSMLDYRALLHLFAQVNSYDPLHKEYSIPLDQFCEKLGYDPKARRATKTKMRHLLEALDKKICWIDVPDGNSRKDTRIRFFDVLRIGQNIEFSLGKDFALRFMLNTDKSYVQIDPYIANCIDSPIAMRLYLLLKSYANLGQRFIPLSELKRTIYDLAKDDDGNEIRKGSRREDRPDAKTENKIFIRDIKRALKALRTKDDTEDLTDLHIEMQTAMNKSGELTGIKFRITETENGDLYHDLCHETTRSRSRKATEQTKRDEHDAETIIEDILDNGKIDIEALKEEYPDAYIIVVNFINHAPGVDDPGERKAGLRYMARNIDRLRPAWNPVLRGFVETRSR